MSQYSPLNHEETLLGRGLIYHSCVIVSPHSIQVKPMDMEGEAPNLALGLLRTTKTIYAEALPYIWKNKFKTSTIESYKRFPETYEALRMNVKEITHCYTESEPHQQMLSVIHEFTSLKTLNLKMSLYHSNLVAFSVME